MVLRITIGMSNMRKRTFDQQSSIMDSLVDAAKALNSQPVAHRVASSNPTGATSSVISAVSSTADRMTQAVQPSIQPMCKITEASTCLASNNTISFGSSSAISVVESVATPVQLLEPLASQPICALSEVGQCLVYNNTSTALAVSTGVMPSFPILANAGTACSTIGQCAVGTNSNLFVPAIAITAAVFTGIAAGFAFRSMFAEEKEALRPVRRRRIGEVDALLESSGIRDNQARGSAANLSSPARPAGGIRRSHRVRGARSNNERGA